MIKTVNLNENVTAVDVAGKQNVTVKNIGNNTAYVSASPDISVCGDGVISVKAGEIITLEGVATLKKVGNQYGVHGTVYALASGATTIELIPTNSVNFKPAAVDYSRDIADISSLIPTAASAENQLTDKAYVDSELSEKVDKADGMGLSSNDYTTAEKDKLAALTNYDDSTVNSAIADLQAGKADKSDTYTKTETDTKITEKVAEIVADAPEDFDTLKEMADWIANHENDATAMNSAIQANTSNIASLQEGKVDKETGKSLVSDSEIAKLASLENYDDTAVKADIADIQGLIPSSASPENQLADKAYVSAMQSSSPYIYMTQAEYEALTEYEPDRLYWVTYPLSKCHLVWCNGECVDGLGAENLAGYELPYSNSSYKSYAKCNYKYLAISYNPISGTSQSTYPNLIKMDIAKGVTSIGNYAFYDCESLTNITIPDNVTSIGIGAFSGCTALTNITIPDNVTSIGMGAFRYCRSLTTDIIIPEGVANIGYETFLSCKALTFVSIPSTVTSIAVAQVIGSSAAFDGCTQSDLTIVINKPKDSITGSPWGATNATVVWAG